MSYVPLHVHSHFSFLDGHGIPDRYMEAGKKLGLPAMGITDHGNICGILDWYEQAIDKDIKPILGEEFYQARKTRFDQDDEERAGKAIDDLEQRGPYHLTVFARNQAGYKNLLKLSSRAYLEGFYVKPRIDYELLADHSEGLIVLSGCLNGAVNQALLRNDFEAAFRAASYMQDIVGKDNYYIEVQDHGLPEQKRVLDDCLAIAEKIQAPIVPTGDCHYVYSEDAESHDLLLCLSTGATKMQEQRFKFFGPEFYLKSYDEMRRLFPEQWLRNTLDVADSVDLTLKFGDLYFPSFPLPEGREINEYLEESIWNGLKIRYGWDLPQEVIDRANYEIKVIKEVGFQEYFLVVADLVRFARENGIRTGVGRGSSAASIISYALKITGLDPLKFNLLFERFLVPGRKSPPDIDLDFDDRYRDKVIEYARTKYGSDRLANICTFSKLGARSAIKDTARILGYDFLTGDRISKMVPPPVQGFAPTLAESLADGDLKKEYESNDDSRQIIDAAKGLEGLYRQTGIHAAGVVIARGPVIDYLPVMQKGVDKPIVTQWEDDRVEQVGKLKIDFLGLRNLSVIDIAIANISERHNKLIIIEKVALDDEEVYKALCSGDSIGVFQFEGAGIRDLMKSLMPSTIEDLMAINALYRPGPLGSNMHKSYIARKHSREEITYYHPSLAKEPIFNNYYGIMLYQESILIAARVLAGFTVAEADDLRKCVGKKQREKIKQFREKFVDGCAKTSNINSALANKIYSDIEFFGAYGFPLPHAGAYAVIAYWTAWLKIHYPIEYMAALLSTVWDDKDKMSVYLNECRKMGIIVHPPSINESYEDFRIISDNEILFGLKAVKGLGPAACAAIVSSRAEKYTSIYDFMRRTDLQVLDKTILESLIESGALDELAPMPTRAISREDKLRLLDIEKERLGLYVSEHPLLGVWSEIEARITHTAADLIDTPSDFVKVGGMLTQVERRTTKKGDKMYRLTLEDIIGPIEVTVFPRETKKFEELFSKGALCIVEGRLEKEDDRPTNKVLLLRCSVPKIDYETEEPIVLHFPYIPSPDILKRVDELIEHTPGNNPVYIEFNKFGHTIILKTRKPTSLSIKDKLELLTFQERIGL